MILIVILRQKQRHFFVQTKKYPFFVVVLIFMSNLIAYSILFNKEQYSDIGPVNNRVSLIHFARIYCISSSNEIPR